jgi:hypothetical protein
LSISVLSSTAGEGAVKAELSIMQKISENLAQVWTLAPETVMIRKGALTVLSSN